MKYFLSTSPQMFNRTCIILAGGKGTRLNSVLNNTPKCLAPVNEFTFLELQMQRLAREGVDNFVLSLGYGAEMVQERLKMLRDEFMVACVVEEKPLLTGGAIKYAMETLSIEECLVVNGDSVVSGDMSGMLDQLTDCELVRMGMCSVNDRSRYGGVRIDNLGRVLSFGEKKDCGPGLINAGIYTLRFSAFQSVMSESFSLEKELLPKLIQERKVSGHQLAGNFIDIGVPSDYGEFIRNTSAYLE